MVFEIHHKNSLGTLSFSPSALAVLLVHLWEHFCALHWHLSLSHDHLNSRKVLTYSINTVVNDREEKFKKDKMSATSAPECFCSANIQLFMFMQFKKPPQSSCLNVVF